MSKTFKIIITEEITYDIKIRYSYSQSVQKGVIATVEECPVDKSKYLFRDSNQQNTWIMKKHCEIYKSVYKMGGKLL